MRSLRLIRPFYIVLLGCGFYFSNAHADTFSAKVIAVLDGDTVLIAQSGRRPLKVRLAEIDAPEKSQPFGMRSRQALVDQVLNREVLVETVATDKYGRWVAQLLLNGRSVNQQQVSSGMAWEYSYFHRNKDYIALQREAQQARRGLWSQLAPTSPWEWRKAHSDTGHLPPKAEGGANDFICGSKHRCTQMHSCDEAHFYLSHCGLSTLDKDGDGIPCPTLCLPANLHH